MKELENLTKEQLLELYKEENDFVNFLKKTYEDAKKELEVKNE